jgi:hypothetical protein
VKVIKQLKYEGVKENKSSKGWKGKKKKKKRIYTYAKHSVLPKETHPINI